MKKNLDQYSNEELISELTENRGFVVTSPDIVGASEVLDFVVNKLDSDVILHEIDNKDIVDYLCRNDFIAGEDESDMAEFGYIRIDKGAGGNFYHKECIDLFRQLVEKNGSDFVYALLEPYKIV